MKMKGWFWRFPGDLQVGLSEPGGTNIGGNGTKTFSVGKGGPPANTSKSINLGKHGGGCEPKWGGPKTTEPDKPLR